MIPLYGFLHGDTLGLLILADADDRADLVVTVGDRALDPRTKVRDSGLAALDRFDVVPRS